MAILEKELGTQIDGTPRRFTRDEYYKMGTVGILGECDELIDGIVYVKASNKPWHWTCDDYETMYQNGIIEHEERIELIEGEIITLAPIGPEHRSAMVGLLRILFKLEERFGADYYVMPESPVKLSNDVEPQPDIAVANGAAIDYVHRHPRPSDLRLIVEVSSSSVKRDRTKKYRIYAQMGIPEYWIINLKTRQVEVYRQPSGTGYAEMLTFQPGDSIETLFAPGVEIAVSDFMPAHAI